MKRVLVFRVCVCLIRLSSGFHALQSVYALNPSTLGGGGLVSAL